MGHELHASDLTYAFPGFVFGPVSLRLIPGRVYGLLGPNGAGKSTFLNLLTQQLRPKGGRLAYGDRDIHWDDPLWKACYSYIRETPEFYDELRVREVLAFTGRIYERWDAQLASRLVERLQLDPDKTVGALSKGNRVKLGLVAGLASQAEILFLDEPTAGLDPTVRAEVQRTLSDLMTDRGGDLCMVLSSHIFEDLEQVADDVLILRDGLVRFRALRTDLDRLVLFRCESSTEIDTEGASLSWYANETRWILAHRDEPLAEALAHDPQCFEERPRSVMEAIYHGVQRMR